MNDDEFDAVFRARVTEWTDEFAEPAMPELDIAAGPTRSPRVWFKPFAVATSLVAAAALTVTLIVNMPAKNPSTADTPALLSLPAGADLVVRDIPRTYDFAGLTLDFTGTIPWHNAYVDELDPRSIWIEAGDSRGPDRCNPLEVPVVTAEASGGVAIAVAQYSVPRDDDEETACTADLVGPNRLKVELLQPLGTRINDVTDDGVVQRVVDPQVLPRPGFLPDGFTGGEFSWSPRYDDPESSTYSRAFASPAEAGIRVILTDGKPQDPDGKQIDAVLIGDAEASVYRSSEKATTTVAWTNSDGDSVAVVGSARGAKFDAETLLEVARSIEFTLAAKSEVGPLPETVVRGGKTYELIGSINWAGAVRTDATSLRMTLPSYQGGDGCSWTLPLPFITESDKQGVTVEVGEYAEKVDETGEMTCIGKPMILGSTQVTVKLPEDMGDRVLRDGAGKVHRIIGDEDFPAPTYVPDTYTGGELIWNEPAFATVVRPAGNPGSDPAFWRYYSAESNWLLIEARNETTINAGPKVESVPAKVSGRSAQITTGPESPFGPLKCLRWLEDTGLAMSVCSAGFPLANDELVKVANSIGRVSRPAEAVPSTTETAAPVTTLEDLPEAGHPNAVPINWHDAVADENDPKSLWISAGQDGGHDDWCTPSVYASVTEETSDSVTVLAVEEGPGPKPTDQSCDAVTYPPHRVKVTLGAPLGTRLLFDANESQPRSPETVANPTSSPDATERPDALPETMFSGGVLYEFDSLQPIDQSSLSVNGTLISLTVHDGKKACQPRHGFAHSDETDGSVILWLAAYRPSGLVGPCSGLSMELPITQLTVRLDESLGTRDLIDGSTMSVVHPAAASSGSTSTAPPTVPVPPAGVPAVQEFNGTQYRFKELISWQSVNLRDDGETFAIPTATDGGLCSDRVGWFAGNENADSVTLWGAVFEYPSPTAGMCTVTGGAVLTGTAQVPLSSPLAGREVIDGSDNVARQVLRSTDLATPDYLPEGYAGGDLEAGHNFGTAENPRDSVVRVYQNAQTELSIQKVNFTIGFDPEFDFSTDWDVPISGYSGKSYGDADTLCLRWEVADDVLYSICANGPAAQVETDQSDGPRIDLAELVKIAESLHT